MKSLLHSKRFRKNLYKWLFMYTGVMLLLTNVITYSKYISKFELEDKARMAKFNVEIKSLDNCLTEEGNQTSTNCNTGTSRPTSEITYNFAVKTELEVKTELTVSIFANADFKIVSVLDGTGQEIASCANQTSCSTPIKTINPGVETNNYQVKVIYNGEETLNGNYMTEKEYADVIHVGYSLIQVTKEG